MAAGVLANGVWNINTLEWDKMQQPILEGGTVNVSLANPLPVSIAAGADVVEGNTTDAAVVTDAAGTVSGKLRGLVKWAFERMPTALGQTTMSASLPVTIASDQSTLPVKQNDVSATGSITSTQTVSLVIDTASTLRFKISGTWTGTILFEGSLDGSTFFSVVAPPIDGGTLNSSTTINRDWVVSVAGLHTFRVRGGTVSSGTANVVMRAGQGSVFSQTFIGRQTSQFSVPVALSTDEMVNISALSTPYSATITAAAQEFSTSFDQFNTQFLFQVSGTFSGSFVLEGTINDANGWFLIPYYAFASPSVGDLTSAITATGMYSASVGGITDVRLRSTAWTSGTAVIDGSIHSGSVPTRQPVSATILPLPTGAATLAEQQTQTASLGVIDDWDETDRAKVNPIVGQAGVQGGAGTVSSNTIRVAVATDANVVSTKTDLTPASPAAASVGVASAQVVAANATRKGLKLINTSANLISLGFGTAAVLNSGITLYPAGVFSMDEYDFDLGAVNAIASAASSNLAIQEFST